MKRTAMIFIAVLTLAASMQNASAQRLVIGEKAPDVQASQWLGDSPSGGKARLINFFHSSSPEAVSILPDMNGYAKKYEGRLDVVVVARESESKVRPTLMKDSPKYYAAIDDDGKTFAAFSVKVVPFGVLVDARGRVLWFGNPTQLDDEMLGKLLK